MGRLVVILVVLAGAYYAYTEYSGTTTGLRVEGRELHLSTADLDFQFHRGAEFADTLMVFGGDSSQPRNSFTHVTLAALPEESARLIHRDHPDFHRCSSPGARQAQRLVQTFSMLGGTSRARKALVGALTHHDAQLHSGGDRTCLSVQGARIELTSARVRETGQELGREITSRLPSSTQLVLADDARMVECLDILR